MTGVVYGKKWEIRNSEDLLAALEILEENKYVAEMSDSWAVTRSELDEVEKQRVEVLRQAREAGVRRYEVQYGNHWGHEYRVPFDNPDKAIAYAKGRVGHPHYYMYANVYDLEAKGDVKLVWDHNRGKIQEYVG